MTTVALYTPSGTATKVTVNVVLDPDATVVGKVIPPTVKLAACAPAMVIVETTNGSVPVFWMV
jgi:hypothetical protein